MSPSSLLRRFSSDQYSYRPTGHGPEQQQQSQQQQRQQHRFQRVIKATVVPSTGARRQHSKDAADIIITDPGRPGPYCSAWAGPWFMTFVSTVGNRLVISTTDLATTQRRGFDGSAVAAVGWSWDRDGRRKMNTRRRTITRRAWNVAETLSTAEVATVAARRRQIDRNGRDHGDGLHNGRIVDDKRLRLYARYIVTETAWRCPWKDEEEGGRGVDGSSGGHRHMEAGCHRDLRVSHAWTVLMSLVFILIDFSRSLASLFPCS